MLYGPLRQRDPRPASRRRIALVTVTAVTASLLSGVAPAFAAPANLAPFGIATASSSENAGVGPEKAIDGDPATRWSSSWSDPQSLTVDLGSAAKVSGVTLLWEAAHASRYVVETSTDGAAWTTVHDETAGNGGTDEITGLDATARYVRLTGTARATEYGYSLFEFQVLGEFSTQAVSLTAGSARLAENGTVAVPARLNKASDQEVSVAYATADGTAVAGADYRAATGRLTFPPGSTEQTITLSAIDDGVHEPAKNFTLALSEPAPAGTLVGPRGQATVTVVDNDPLPYDGKTLTVADFQTGVPAEIAVLGADPPALSTVAATDRPGAGTGNEALQVTYDINTDGGVAHTFGAAQNWTAYDGLAFWLKGTGSGRKLSIELKDGGTDAGHSELFDLAITDDVAGWKRVEAPFKRFKRRASQPAGAPTDGKVDRVAVWGYAVHLPVGAGTLLVDQVEAYEQLLIVDRFEGEVPFTQPPGPGLFTFGSDADDNPRLSLKEAAHPGSAPGNKVLHADYDISGWGGIVHNISFDTEPRDWSAFEGIRFWWYGQNTAPLPPGSGPRIFFEVKDGGANAEASELWNTSFTDDFQGWTLITIPFAQLRYRGDYQPVGGIDRILTLNETWGYAFSLPGGQPGQLDLDAFEVYGVAPEVPKARVATDRPVYPVKEGETATLRVVLTTTSGKPLEEPVTVSYATGEGTATAGKDYAATSGKVTFAAGAENGAAQEFAVLSLRDKSAETGESIPIRLESDGAAITDDLPTVVIGAHGLPYLDRRLPVQKRVKDLLARMTLDEKIGQMTQAERNVLQTQDDIATAYLGSLLSGGGSVPTPNTPKAWADMVDGYQLRAQQTRLQIPLIYGVDAVHGHNNVVGATLFPHNLGLGATRDPNIVGRTGKVTATEVRSTGVPWDFSPCLCVARDERWGRTYESYSEDPALVTQLASIVSDMQGRNLAANDSVLATAKHYVGDGGTTYGSSTTGNYKIDQGVTEVTRQELEAIHLRPFVEAVKRDVGTVMPSYSSVDYLGDQAGPVKMHAHAELINGVLKKKLGFQGFVISDWQAIDQIPGDYASDVRTSINGGLDMIMVPTQYSQFEQALKAEVQAGRVSQARIDDAVGRILRQKFRLGLFDKPYADRTHLADVGSAAHRAVAREAAAKSQVLLKNTGNLLPLRRDAKLYVAGGNADDLGNQAGGWSISWQGSSGAITTGTTILGGIRAVAPGATVTHSRDASAPLEGHDVGVVVVGETPYAEGVGDVGVGGRTLDLTAADQAAVDKVCAAMKCVVLVVSGRPLILGDQLAKAHALVASWLPGSEGTGVADVLFGARPFTGRLPITWPKSLAQVPINVGDRTYDPLYPYGWGLRTDPARSRLQAVRNELAQVRGDFVTALAVFFLDQALRSANWNADGSVRNAAAVFGSLRVVASVLTVAKKDTVAQNDAVASVARDVAQAAIERGGAPAASRTAALTAGADQALASGRTGTAVEQLYRAYRLAG
jgi:beta-glucosidase